MCVETRYLLNTVIQKWTISTQDIVGKKAILGMDRYHSLTHSWTIRNLCHHSRLSVSELLLVTYWYSSIYQPNGAGQRNTGTASVIGFTRLIWVTPYPEARINSCRQVRIQHLTTCRQPKHKNKKHICKYRN